MIDSWMACVRRGRAPFLPATWPPYPSRCNPRCCGPWDFASRVAKPSPKIELGDDAVAGVGDVRWGPGVLVLGEQPTPGLALLLRHPGSPAGPAHADDGGAAGGAARPAAGDRFPGHGRAGTGHTGSGPQPSGDAARPRAGGIGTDAGRA